MRVLGLTGDIASGKSTVAALLQERGAAHIDADLLVRELYADHGFARRLQSEFGAEKSILDRDGAVDRAALAAIVFNDKRALQQLEAIVHPAVGVLRDEKMRALKALPSPPNVVVLEAVKLIESGERDCREVWCVRASPHVQLRRLMQNRGLDETAARARLANQPPFAQKKVLLGAIPLREIWNDGTLDDLKIRVDAEWNRFIAES